VSQDRVKDGQRIDAISILNAMNAITLNRV
jgi:hypothetical protein